MLVSNNTIKQKNGKYLYEHICDTCSKPFLGIKKRKYCCLGCAPRHQGPIIPGTNIAEQYNARHARYRAKNPEKVKAGQLARDAVYAGKIKKQPCEICGCLDSQMHHQNYTKPFEVNWLCYKHHRDVHKGLIKLKGMTN